MVPRWIHQTAPSDPSRWKPSWSMCQDTVKRHFREFRYTLWSDEDLDKLVREHFAWFYPVFRSYPEPIYRADAGRYMILYLYGGIYLDMDYEVLENFYSQLDPNHPSIVESPFPNMENLQNSLMASPARHPFWLKVLREMASSSTVFFHSVLDATGPRMLDRVCTENPNEPIHVLSSGSFNPPPKDRIYNSTQWHDTNQKVYARHRCSASWRV